MQIIERTMQELMIFEPSVFKEETGCIYECYNKKDLEDIGIYDCFIQDNHSKSQKGVLRGLHFQKKYAQAQIVRVVKGEIFDVAVNINPKSPYFGKYFSAILSEENKRQFYMSKDFAHGFLVLSDYAEVLYKCSQFYHPEDEGGIIYNDPFINIKWPFDRVEKIFVGKKDLAFPKMLEVFPLESIESIK